MADQDRRNDERDYSQRAFDAPADRHRQEEERGRREGMDYQRSYGDPQRLGPTGMISHNPAGGWGTSGRYYEDFDARAEYAGYGGYPRHAPRPAHASGRDESESEGDGAREAGRRYAAEPAPERNYRSYGERESYRDYARRTGGYAPNPREGIGRGERSWSARASDEARTWSGDEDAERRRDWDAMGRGEHRGRGPKGYRRSDERIREDVNDRLTDDPFVDASEVQVEVSGGEVTLNGTVHSRLAKRRAEDCADAVSGVSQVQNNLRIVQTPAPGALGAHTDPRVAAASEGRPQGEASKPAR
ncbi:MAG TPA: BON domain-containing protein [Caulobacteraceae bacterium]|nr:BON domain-containing protein [Caulobacteraceae bacterium]